MKSQWRCIIRKGLQQTETLRLKPTPFSWLLWECLRLRDHIFGGSQREEIRLIYFSASGGVFIKFFFFFFFYPFHLKPLFPYFPPVRRLYDHSTIWTSSPPVHNHVSHVLRGSTILLLPFCFPFPVFAGWSVVFTPNVSSSGFFFCTLVW